jgi:hypothetical protein
MKKLNVCLLAFSAGQVLHAGTVIADFNDLAPGDLNGKTGGTGFAASAWINNSAGTAETFIDVVTGNLTAPAATNYSLPQSGAAQSAQNTNGTTSLQTRALATPLTGDTVWFSFLLNQPTASPGVTTGSRGGICLNQATTFHDPNNPRIMGLGSQLTAWLTGNNDVVVNSAFTAGTTAVVLGRILVSDTGNETLSLWVNPNVNALGTPTATHSGANWVGPTGITSVSVQSYGGSNGGIVDAFRISDDPDAYAQVTGSTIPDPVLAVDPGSSAESYAFGVAYPGSTTRTVTFRNEGPNNSITVQNVSLTNDAGGVFTVDNVMPAIGSTLAPGETMSIRLAAQSMLGGNFTGELSIDTNENPQDKTLPVTVSVYVPGQKINPNPTLEAGLGQWSTAAAVAPGIAPGSTGMARVRGKGDKGVPLDETDTLGQGAAIPSGAANWELGCYFTPVGAADYELYTGTPADGTFQDRSFQLAVYTGDNNPATSMADAQALNALLQIAYLPAGNGTDPEGFYAFNGTTWTRLAGLPTISGSVDVDEDGLLEPGTDTIRAYRLNVRGSDFGSGAASYAVTVSGGELGAPVTQSGIVLSAGALISTATPGSYAFTSSDASSLSNAAGGLCTPFWVDDVFYYATAMPEPSLTVPGSVAISGFNQAAPSTTVWVRNDGRTNQLDVSAITFADPELSVASPALPIHIAPGTAVAVEVQLNSAALAPDTALLSTMQIASNDPSQPVTVVPVSASSTATQNLLANWNFETSGLAPNNGDNFAYWNELDVRLRSVPGLFAGSLRAVYLDSTGATTSITQTLSSRLSDFDLVAGFAVRSTANRAFSMILNTGAGLLKLRYESSKWWALDGETWRTLIDMTGAPLTPSVDSNFDGDFLDAGESFTAYKLHITGSGWGTATPSYQIQILDAAGTPIASGAASFSWFQHGLPVTQGLATVQFDNFDGTNPGFWVDDIALSQVLPSSDLKITAFAVNRMTGLVSLTFTSIAGTNYTIKASNDLGLTDAFAQVHATAGSAGTTTVNFTDSAATGESRRFYRVETP